MMQKITLIILMLILPLAFVHPGFAQTENTRSSQLPQQKPALTQKDIQLFQAVRGTDKKTVAKLLDDGANIDARDELGRTPLHISILESRKSSITKLLIKKGADVKAQDNLGNSAMHHAAVTMFKGNRKVRALTKAKAPAKLKNNKGQTPMDVINDESILKIFEKIPGSNPQLAHRYRQTRFEAVYEAQILTSNYTRTFAINPGALIVKPVGSSKKCYYAMVIGNFTGSGLRGQFLVRLTDGSFQEYSSKAGGQFYIPGSAGALKHTIWLNKGATIRLAVVSDRGGSWSDAIAFKTDPNCKDGRRDIYGKKFVVELDNNTSRISIFEDKDGDGRRDDDLGSSSLAIQSNPATNQSDLDLAIKRSQEMLAIWLTPEMQRTSEEYAQDVKRAIDASATWSNPATDQCVQLSSLATEIVIDNSALVYSDEQITGLYQAFSCKMPPSVTQQRNQIKSLINKNK